VNQWFANMQTWLTSVPWAVHAPVLLALLTGLVIWLFGGKVLKPAFTVACVCTGGLFGSILMPTMISDQVMGVPSPYLGMALGGVIGIAVAIAVYRAVMASAGALVFALVGFLGAGVYLSHQPGSLTPSPRDPERPMDQRLVEAATEFGKAAKVDPAQAAKGVVTIPAEQMREIAKAASSEIGDVWSRMPTQSRLTLVGGAFGAAIVGLFFGAVFPRRAAAVITALLGSAILLGSVTWLVRTLDLPMRGWFDLSATGWLSVWGIVAAVGGAIQLSSAKDSRDRRSAPSVDTPAGSPKPAKA
jgi:hypothetical protein